MEMILFKTENNNIDGQVRDLYWIVNNIMVKHDNPKTIYVELWSHLTPLSAINSRNRISCEMITLENIDTSLEIRVSDYIDIVLDYVENNKLSKESKIYGAETIKINKENNIT